MNDHQTRTAIDMFSDTHDCGCDPGDWLVMLTLLYFVPSIIAFSRRHRHRTAINHLNAILGWSVLGWIAAFLWALTSPGKGLAMPATAAPESMGDVPEHFATRLLTGVVERDLTSRSL
ncbi:superinfection immunity protein [Paraburkholderia sacchari]|uniref:superinfection immunity protein n=1 Tax=Paraburkholderia sacchari TaxID=159450 RepID=UPI001BCDAA3C|nr:superinfection immunity protein [Paraburkholderia sacchari]